MSTETQHHSTEHVPFQSGGVQCRRLWENCDHPFWARSIARATWSAAPSYVGELKRPSKQMAGCGYINRQAKGARFVAKILAVKSLVMERSFKSNIYPGSGKRNMSLKPPSRGLPNTLVLLVRDPCPAKLGAAHELVDAGRGRDVCDPERSGTSYSMSWGIRLRRSEKLCLKLPQMRKTRESARPPPQKKITIPNAHGPS